METLEAIVAAHPFFKSLAPHYLQLAVGCAANVRIDPDQFICRAGAEANEFYLIRDGRVALELNVPAQGPHIIQTLEPGDILGWSWLFPPHRWHFDARAVKLTRTIALDGKCLRTKCEEDHEFGYELLMRFSNILVQNLEATRLQLLDLCGSPAPS